MSFTGHSAYMGKAQDLAAVMPAEHAGWTVVERAPWPPSGWGKYRNGGPGQSRGGCVLLVLLVCHKMPVKGTLNVLALMENQ
ncbi:hypothetical protein D3C79_968530 [compost metagenome]